MHVAVGPCGPDPPLVPGSSTECVRPSPSPVSRAIRQSPFLSQNSAEASGILCLLCSHSPRHHVTQMPQSMSPVRPGIQACVDTTVGTMGNTCARGVGVTPPVHNAANYFIWATLRTEPADAVGSEGREDTAAVDSRGERVCGGAAEGTAWEGGQGDGRGSQRRLVLRGEVCWAPLPLALMTAPRPCHSFCWYPQVPPHQWPPDCLPC